MNFKARFPGDRWTPVEATTIGAAAITYLRDTGCAENDYDPMANILSVEVREGRTTHVVTIGFDFVEDGRRDAPQFAVRRILEKSKAVAERAREEAEDALRAVVAQIGRRGDYGALTNDEIRDLTATLEGVAKKLEAT